MHITRGSQVFNNYWLFSEFSNVRVKSRSDFTSDGKESKWEARWRNRVTLWKATTWKCYERNYVWGSSRDKKHWCWRRGEKKYSNMLIKTISFVSHTDSNMCSIVFKALFKSIPVTDNLLIDLCFWKKSSDFYAIFLLCN